MSVLTDTILVADIGGTNARFAVGSRSVDGAVTLGALQDFPGDDFIRPEDAIAGYLERTGARPAAAAFAVAGPVRGGAARLTNRDWSFTEEALRAATGAQTAVLLNDFAAAALSLPLLPPDRMVSLGGPNLPAGLWT